MRWLAVVALLLTGCLRARATVIHPTELTRSSHTGPNNSIARTASETPEVESPEMSNISSLELGVLVPFRKDADSARVHIAPGIRVFDTGMVMGGVALGADFKNRFALEGSVYFGDGHADPTVIEQAVDLFGGVTTDVRSTSLAIGPSVGLLMMPGGNSVVMVGLGVRVTGARE